VPDERAAQKLPNAKNPQRVRSRLVSAQRMRESEPATPGVGDLEGTGLASNPRMLDQLIPTPRLIELDDAEVAAPPDRVWELLRHGDLGRSPLIRALFAIRTLPERWRGEHPDTGVRIDDLRSTVERPGFSVLLEEAPREFAVGAIGKVWELEIPFVHVSSPGAFRDFREPGYAKVAWSVRVTPLGDRDSRVDFEVRVDTTDEDSWQRFERYFRVIGPGSHFIRHTVLGWLRRELGTPDAQENERPLPGDELIPDAMAQMTHGITIAARPEQIWPWLLQLGCRRAGFYSIDWLDNGRVRSARELHPEWMHLAPGQVIPATPTGDDGFEVLRVEGPLALVLGGLHDVDEKRQLRFVEARPARFWHVTWAFVLSPIDANTTRLHVRVRAAHSASERLHLAWIRPVHHLMQSAMLKHLAERAEGRLPPDDARDILSGAGGAGIMLAALLTPFLREARSHWGISAEAAARRHPGDDLVVEPRWSWTHAVEIEASSADVWPWVAQIGAERAGFYSYQWLENLVGCGVRNAEQVRPEWQVNVGQELVLHPAPEAPRLKVVAVERGRYFVAQGPPDVMAQSQGKPWSSASWLFLVEPLSPHRCRFISRFRAACSDDIVTRLGFGPTLLEPVGFAMDRRMLLGVKERVEGLRRNRRLRLA
jgi:hypothetical protein